jgi:hypothetical protein
MNEESQDQTVITAWGHLFYTYILQLHLFILCSTDESNIPVLPKWMMLFIFFAL